MWAWQGEFKIFYPEQLTRQVVTYSQEGHVATPFSYYSQRTFIWGEIEPKIPELKKHLFKWIEFDDRNFI